MQQFTAGLAVAVVLGITTPSQAQTAQTPEIDAIRARAERGDPDAQYELGLRYADGRGVPRDLTQTHLWFSLAASRMSGDKRDSVVRYLDNVTSRLNPIEIAEARRLAREWKASHLNADQPNGPYDYQLLATTRTSTMEREMNEAAELGYRFQGVMGGGTAFGGSELVTIMMRGASTAGRFSYRLLATNQTSTMQEEMQQAGNEGYDYRGLTVYKSEFGGDEVIVIMEHDNDAPPVRYEFLLLATSRTSTLQKELTDAGHQGFESVGLSVGQTYFAGDEVLAVVRRTLPQ